MRGLLAESWRLRNLLNVGFGVDWLEQWHGEQWWQRVTPLLCTRYNVRRLEPSRFKRYCVLANPPAYTFDASNTRP
jgi:hypothetical protein